MQIRGNKGFINQSQKKHNIKIHYNITTKYLTLKPNGYYYYQIRLIDNVYQYSLKTKDLLEAILKRNKINDSLNFKKSIEHDKITLSITLKILGIKKMFEEIDFNEINKNLKTPEEEKKIQEKLNEKHFKELKQKEDEENRLKILQLQHEQNILNIKNDSKLKYENNEFNLTEEQIKLIRENKSIQENNKIIHTVEKETLKEYFNLKEYWDKFIENQIITSKEKILTDSKERKYKFAFELLTGFVSENENILNLDFNFFIDFQEILLFLPVNFKQYKELGNLTVKEICELNKKENKYQIIKNKTLETYLNYYSQFSYFLKKRRIIREDIFEKIKLEIEESEKRPFTEDELKLWFDNDIYIEEKKEVMDLSKIAIYSGMRLAEIIGLRKTDIIEIEGVKCFDLNDKFRRLKTNNAKRIIPIHSKILDLVEEYLKIDNNEYLILSGHSHNEGSRISRVKIKIFKDNKEISFHSFRHNFITALEDNNVNDYTSKLLGGHSKKSTNDTYKKTARLKIEILKEDIEKIHYKIFD